jgi:hypothetical protein
MTDSDSDDSIFLTQTNVTTAAETDCDTDKACDTALEIINDSNHSRRYSVQCSDISSAEDENQTASDDELFATGSYGET